MKKIYLSLLILVTICLNASAQQSYQDVVYLKNGSIIRGTIIEQVPNQYLKIETPDRSVFVYQMSEITKMARELVQAKQKSSNVNFKKGVYWGLSVGGNLGMWKNASPFMRDVESNLALSGMNVTLNKKPLLGVNAGLLLGYKLKKWFEIQLEVNYLMKGQGFSGKGTFNYQGTINDISLKERMYVSYIQIPVVAKFITKPGFYVSVGPHIEAFTDAFNYTYVKVAGEPDHQSDPIKGQANPVNYGFLVGVGFEGRTAGFEVRYVHDFLDTFKPEYDSYQLKNRVIEFTINLFYAKR